MGAWGIGILENDDGLDARGVFEDLIEQGHSVPSALAEAREALAEALDDDEWGPDVLLGLAWCAASRGELPEDLRQEAIAILREERAFEKWQGAPDEAGRKAIEERFLAVLEDRLDRQELGAISGQNPG